jgi:fructuronate reductase
MRYVTGIDEKGQPIDVKDPLASRFKSIAEAAGQDAAKLASALLGITAIFGHDLPANSSFRDLITVHLGSLFDNGALETVRRVVS